MDRRTSCRCLDHITVQPFLRVLTIRHPLGFIPILQPQCQHRLPAPCLSLQPSTSISSVGFNPFLHSSSIPLLQCDGYLHGSCFGSRSRRRAYCMDWSHASHRFLESDSTRTELDVLQVTVDQSWRDAACLKSSPIQNSQPADHQIARMVYERYSTMSYAEQQMVRRAETQKWLSWLGKKGHIQKGHV